tara:strand:- start:134 stop:241 length:108 start_codon:yes stop_codon:yes gene_type:complete
MPSESAMIPTQQANVEIAWMDTKARQRAAHARKNA